MRAALTFKLRCLNTYCTVDIILWPNRGLPLIRAWLCTVSIATSVHKWVRWAIRHLWRCYICALKQRFQLSQPNVTHGRSAYLHQKPLDSGHVWTRSIETLHIGAQPAPNIPEEMVCAGSFCVLSISLFIWAAICMLIRFCLACAAEYVYENSELVDIFVFLPAEKDRILLVNSDLFLDSALFFLPSQIFPVKIQRHSSGFPLHTSLPLK